jgi:alpha-tubulin suppressor-like RCC1 family protein
MESHHGVHLMSLLGTPLHGVGISDMAVTQSHSNVLTCSGKLISWGSNGYGEYYLLMINTTR